MGSAGSAACVGKTTQRDANKRAHVMKISTSQRGFFIRKSLRFFFDSYATFLLPNQIALSRLIIL